MLKPIATSGQAIGLFGGTFDPPHAGHVLAARRALRRMDLDQIWWIPTLGNPLKSRQAAPIADRIALIEEMIQDPKMKVYDLETEFGTTFTIDTITAIQRRFPKVSFVMVTGADIIAEFHHWHRWNDLARMIPICAIARPEQQLAAGLSPFAQSFAQYRVEAGAAKMLPKLRAPAWTILPGVMSAQSSSKIRAAQVKRN